MEPRTGLFSHLDISEWSSGISSGNSGKRAKSFKSGLLEELHENNIAEKNRTIYFFIQINYYGDCKAIKKFTEESAAINLQQFFDCNEQSMKNPEFHLIFLTRLKLFS